MAIDPATIVWDDEPQVQPRAQPQAIDPSSIIWDDTPIVDLPTVQAERPDFRPEMAGEAVGCIHLGGNRCDAVGGEGPHRVAQHVDVVAKTEIEGRDLVGDHGSEPSDCSSRRSVPRITLPVAVSGKASAKRTSRG